MKTAAIVSEYNPFHSGHEYHIAQTRKALGDDCAVIALMSGNFVQRGDFAIMPKHLRAKAALACRDHDGADLVLELPVCYSLSSAEGFARGAVETLDACGIVTHLSFGSEEGSIERLTEIASTLLREDFPAELKTQLAAGVSYAKARQLAVSRLLEKDVPMLEGANNILGIEYIKALIQLGSDITPITVQRKGAEHDGTAGEDEFPSAKQLRELILSFGEFNREMMPQRSINVLTHAMAHGKAPASLKNCEKAIIARLRCLTDQEFMAVDSSGEGLWRRFAAACRTENTVEDIITVTKTKRYARSRIMRMVMRAYLGVPCEPLPAPGYIRVLAFNKKGQKLLKSMRKTAKLPVITKPAHAQLLPDWGGECFKLEYRATDLYQLSLPNGEKGGSEWLQGVVIDE